MIKHCKKVETKLSKETNNSYNKKAMTILFRKKEATIWDNKLALSSCIYKRKIQNKLYVL